MSPSPEELLFPPTYGPGSFRLSIQPSINDTSFRISFSSAPLRSSSITYLPDTLQFPLPLPTPLFHMPQPSDMRPNRLPSFPRLASLQLVPPRHTPRLHANHLLPGIFWRKVGHALRLLRPGVPYDDVPESFAANFIHGTTGGQNGDGLLFMVPKLRLGGGIGVDAVGFGGEGQRRVAGIGLRLGGGHFVDKWKGFKAGNCGGRDVLRCLLAMQRWNDGVRAQGGSGYRVRHTWTARYVWNSALNSNGEAPVLATCKLVANSPEDRVML